MESIMSHLDAMYDAQAYRLIKSGESAKAFFARKEEIVFAGQIAELEARLSSLTA